MERPEDKLDDEDMAEVGRSLMESLRLNHPNWMPADNPAEIVVDLLNDVHDRDQEIERLRAALTGIVGMFRDTQFGTVELDLPNYEVRDAARAALKVDEER